MNTLKGHFNTQRGEPREKTKCHKVAKSLCASDTNATPTDRVWSICQWLPKPVRVPTVELDMTDITKARESA